MTHNTHGGRRHGLSDGPSHRLQIRLTEDQRAWIAAEAAERSVSSADLIRDLVEKARCKAAKKNPHATLDAASGQD